MDPVDWIYETFRDHARDNVCARLQTLGIRAEMAERGRAEEEVTGRGLKSLGVIDVLDRQIGWVCVKRTPFGSSECRGPFDEGGTIWYVQFGVPDQRVAGAFPKVEITASPVRANLWIWKGVDSDLVLSQPNCWQDRDGEA